AHHAVPEIQQVGAVPRRFVELRGLGTRSHASARRVPAPGRKTGARRRLAGVSKRARRSGRDAGTRCKPCPRLRLEVLHATRGVSSRALRLDKGSDAPGGESDPCASAPFATWTG